MTLTRELPVEFYSFMTPEGRKVMSPSPTGAKAHGSQAAMRLVYGPVGTGKSCWAIQEMQKHLINYPNTECYAIRCTYPQLHDSTIPDSFRYLSPNVYRVPGRRDKCWNQQHHELKVIQNGLVKFRSSDQPDKFQSIDQMSFLWLEEAADIPEDTFLFLVGRPRRKDIPLTIVLTSYAPPPKNWLYQLFWTDADEQHVKFFLPREENESNLVPGYYDHLRKIYAHRPDWLTRFVDGLPVFLGKGNPAIPRFDQRIHVTDKIINPVPHLPIIRGWDFGYDWSAVTWFQIVPVKRVAVLGSRIFHYQDIDEVAPQVVAQGIEWFGKAQYRDYSGADVKYRTPQSRESIEERLAKRSITPEFKDFYPGSVEDGLNKLRGLLLPRDDQRPGLIICRSRNETLVEAMAGAYTLDDRGNPDKTVRPHSDVVDSLRYPIDCILEQSDTMDLEGGPHDAVEDRHPSPGKRRHPQEEERDMVDDRYPTVWGNDLR